MSEFKYNQAGEAMVPSGAPDGHFVRVGGVGAIEAARAQRERDLAAHRAAEERRAEARRAADQKHDAEKRRKRMEHEAEAREKAALEVAGVRAAVERQARLDGVPDREIKAVVDEAMRRYHVERASETAAAGPQAERELRDYFRNRRIPNFD